MLFGDPNVARLKLNGRNAVIGLPENSVFGLPCNPNSGDEEAVSEETVGVNWPFKSFFRREVFGATL